MSDEEEVRRPTGDVEPIDDSDDDSDDDPDDLAELYDDGTGESNL